MTTIQTSDDVGSDRPDDFLIVALGASAGGIQALREFFLHLPAESGLAYVVILHLSPDYDSKLAQVLQAVTSMPVTQVMEKVRIAPNQVYVVPPNQHLSMMDGHVVPSPNVSVEERRAPVDIFFRTLADTHGPRAVCVVLSGTGANGSMGLKRIKERGGVAYVQNPREAEFSEMPRYSIATDLVDEVLPVAKIPLKIIAYMKSLGSVQIVEEAEKRPGEQQQALREILTQLRLRTGHDFSNYKPATLLRRIERRINVRALDSLSAYAGFIQQNPEEGVSLMKDLLISVTNFFRDSKAWEVIAQEVLPRLVTDKHAEDQLRIWTAGCATGEEAYSIAMLCAERLFGMPDVPKVLIFATDIDEAAIAQAREGYYSLNDAADVSPERLRRFFTKDGDGYRIRREIRETVLFANHNFLKDPPFSHLDLITCRNVLIYLNNTAQEKAAEAFHFALNPNGFLFLGTSESVDAANDLFSSFNREAHVFRSRPVASHFFPEARITMPPYVPEGPVLTGNFRQTLNTERLSFGELHQQLLEEYAPPSIVMNQEHDLVHISEKAGRYLQIGGGEFSRNLLKLVIPELRLDLRSALFQAEERQSPVEVRDLRITVEGRPEVVNLHIRPVFRQNDPKEGYVLIIIEPAVMKDGESSSSEKVITADTGPALHLEEELTKLQIRLRATVEQYELGGEELKASNEELQAMNEELRSSAEELETTKEELQSINEELQTVNQELKVKVEEATITSNNLQNLMNSANIGAIFLDRSLRIALYTPAIAEIFNLIPSDFGRPITDITNKIHYDDLENDAETVLDKLIFLEREVVTADELSYLMRLLPYRTMDDRINGVVITFFDVTNLKKAEEAVRKSEERFRAFVTASSDTVYRMNADWTEMQNLKGLDFITGIEDPSRKWFQKYIPAEDHAGMKAAISRAIQTISVFEHEHQIYREDGSKGWAFSRAIPILAGNGGIVEWFGAATDITERKRAEESLALHVEELTRFNRAMVSRELRMLELKKEVNALSLQLGQSERYLLTFETEESRTEI